MRDRTAVILPFITGARELSVPEDWPLRFGVRVVSEPFCGEAPMLRILICAVILFACATSSKTVTRDVHDCVYLGLIDGGSRSEIVSETQTTGPSHVFWLHLPEVVRGYLVESNRSLYSCPSPRPAAASFKQG